MKRQRAVKNCHDDGGSNGDDYLCTKKKKDDLKEISFLDCMYEEGKVLGGAEGCEQRLGEESDAFIAVKTRELEKEIDKLSDELKEPYYVALGQEIKQRTKYIRSQKFLLIFLRADDFDTSKAALRLVGFLQLKFDLFGLDSLCRRIRYSDLNHDDKMVLKSGFMSLGGTDYEGRLVCCSRRDRLKVCGFLHEHYVHSLLRAQFYMGMSAIEDNDRQCQQKGVVGVRWSLDSNMSLKEFRILFGPFLLKLFKYLPWKCMAIHSCCSNPLERMCMSYAESLMRRSSQHLSTLNGPSVAQCISELSLYGVDVESLPLNEDGEFQSEKHEKYLQYLVDKDLPKPEPSAMVLSNNNEQYSQDGSKQAPVAPLGSGNLLEPQVLQQEESWCCEKTNATLDVDDEDTIKPDNEVELHRSLFDEIEFDQSEESYLSSSKSAAAAASASTNHPVVEISSPQAVKLQAPSHNVPASSGIDDRNNSAFKLSSVSSEFEQFSLELMSILDCNTYKHAAWWSNDGTVFYLEKQRFSENILTEHFKAIKWNSFLKRLRRWGFQRLPNQSGRGTSKSYVLEYKHRLFQKDSRHLLKCWTEDECIKKDTTKQDRLPVKLMKVLEEADQDESSPVAAIWWVHDGKAFAIDKATFPVKVLEKHFKGVKLQSFFRMLRRWGFKRCSGGENAASRSATTSSVLYFQHPLFQKDLALTSDVLENWPFLVDVDVSTTQAEKFVKKLFDVISNHSTKNHGDPSQVAIWWLDNGNAFAIHTENFIRDVLPQEYNGIKIDSFRRRLKQWGFQKIESDGNVTMYQHPSFRKDSSD